MKDPDSNHDFGKDIIPTLLNDGKKLYAYKFKGYWKDVGTIDSLWEANMDLLSKNNELDLNDPTWKIYTEDATALPQYIGPDAEINHAFVNQSVVRIRSLLPESFCMPLRLLCCMVSLLPSTHFIKIIRSTSFMHFAHRHLASSPINYAIRTTGYVL